MPFVKHLYSASKQISTAISPGIAFFKKFFSVAFLAVSLMLSFDEYSGWSKVFMLLVTALLMHELLQQLVLVNNLIIHEMVGRHFIY